MLRGFVLYVTDGQCHKWTDRRTANASYITSAGKHYSSQLSRGKQNRNTCTLVTRRQEKTRIRRLAGAQV